MTETKASVSTTAVRPGVQVNMALQQSFCRFKHHTCGMPRLEGYDYCQRHILEDKNAPYKLCSYVYQVNGQQCNQAAYKGERRSNGYCVAHARKEQVKRQKASLKNYPPQTPESILTGLSHYAPVEHTAELNRSNNSSIDKWETEKTDDSAGTSVNPFVDIDANKVNASASRILDYASESDSDMEAAVLDTTWKGADADADSSDAESVDSQQEDLLKHAGVYTSEEAMSVTKDKLIRLQSLYIEQFRRLQHILRERRRKYLHTLKREKETLCSISSQARTCAREQKLYSKLKSLNRYHRRNGVEAVLHKKAMERRASVTEGVPGRPSSHFPKCVYTEGGVKCGAKTLPVSKYCLKHILHDSNQILFRPCGCRKGADYECHEPLPDIFEGASCVYHTTIAPMKKPKIEKIEPSQEVEQQQPQLEETLCLDVNMPDKLDISSMEIVMGPTEPDKSSQSTLPQEQWLM